MRPKKVAFIGRGLEVASTRYRIVIPAMQLDKMGWEIMKDADVIIYNKGSVDPEILKLYQHKIYDICDDNIDCAERGIEYRRHISEADIVTCNSDVMRFIVHQKCNRIATVIPDPYEHPEWEPSWGQGLMWFGHWTNLKNLHRLGLEEVTIITDGEQVPPNTQTGQILANTPYIKWSHEAVDKAFKSHAIVVIPTGRAIAKSANRLIESVRAGKFVVAEPLPAYEEFSDLMWVGDIKQGLIWAEDNRRECLERIRACQERIRDKFSPETIGRQWLSVLQRLN